MSLSYRNLSTSAVFLFLPFCFQAQSLPKISADFKNAQLANAFAQLETDYPISFSYEDETIEGLVVTVQIKGMPFERAMKKILTGTGLDFEIIDNRYVLIKRGNAPPAITATPLLPQLNLCGKILDEETSEPLMAATVYVKGTPEGTYTDSLGYFELSGHFSRKDTVVINYVGYTEKTTLVEGFLLKPCVSMKIGFANTWMSDILVKDFSVDMLTLGKEGNFHFKKEKIPTLPGWGEPDVLRMLQLLPGIGSAEESAARLNVRGGTPDQNLVLWEGIPMYHTGHFFGQYDAFNPFIVDEVDVWRGNFGAEQGGRNSCVIDITGRPDIVDESTWGIGFNLLHTNIFMEKPLFRKTKYKRGAILVAGRFSSGTAQSKIFRELFDQVFQNGRIARQDDNRQNEFTTWSPQIQYGDFNIKMRWQGKKKNDNSISIYTGADQLNYYFAFDNDTTFNSTNDFIRAHNFGMSWQHEADWKPNLKANFKMAASTYDNNYSFQWNNVRDSTFIYRYSTSNVMLDVSAQMNVDWQLTKEKKWTFGYHFTAQRSSLIYQDTQVLKGEQNVFSRDTSALELHTFYSAFNHQLNPKFSYSLGLRLNLFPTRNLYFTEPRASFRWNPLGDHFSVKGSLAHNWQFVFQIVDFTDIGAGEPLWALAKDSIPAQELWQTTLGAGYETKTMLIDAEFYYKNSFNLTSRNLLVDRGFERPLSFDGSSVAYGFDLLFRKRIPPYSVWFAYSFGQVKQTFPELNGGQSFPARHDVRHQINFVNMLDLGKIDLSANLHFRTGTPYSIPNVEPVPCPNCTVDDFTYGLSFEKLNTERLPSIIRLDVSATYSFGKKNKKWKMGLSFFNLLNRTNILDKDFLLDTPDPDQPQANFQLQELNRLAAGRAPNFFLQYEW